MKAKLTIIHSIYPFEDDNDEPIIIIILLPMNELSTNDFSRLPSTKRKRFFLLMDVKSMRKWGGFFYYLIRNKWFLLHTILFWIVVLDPPKIKFKNKNWESFFLENLCLKTFFGCDKIQLILLTKKKSFGGKSC